MTNEEFMREINRQDTWVKKYRAARKQHAIANDEWLVETARYKRKLARQRRELERLRAAAN